VFVPATSLSAGTKTSCRSARAAGVETDAFAKVEASTAPSAIRWRETSVPLTYTTAPSSAVTATFTPPIALGSATVKLIRA
jgi:hypothetical protein